MFNFFTSNQTEERLAELEKHLLILEKKIKKLESSITSKKSTDLKTVKSQMPQNKKEIKTVSKKKGTVKKSKLENAITKVMSRTGWTREYTESLLKETVARTGCTPTEFMSYKLYEISEDEQDTFFLAKYQKILQKKYGQNKEFVSMLYDKERTNNYFSEYVRRPWCVNTKVTLDDFKEKFKNSGRVIYKPIAGHMGYGVEAFYIDENNIDDVYKKLSSYPTGVVEEYIKQHPKMASLCPSSINSLRFVTLSSYADREQKRGYTYSIVYSAVRIGSGNSIVDNLHSGGMVANADLSTGILVTNAADCEGNMFITHPDTGTNFKGFEIPYYHEALNMVKEAIEKNFVEGYLGWDIAISETGPKLLEVNDRPGAVVLQTAYAHERKGMKYCMEKFL